jgi:hypothetical protein
MTKRILYALMFCTGLAQAFPGTPTFTTRIAGVEHTLALSHWQVNGKGVPSFDYVYEQRAATCHFRLAGHAIGLTEEVNGKVELVVFNPQDDKGHEAPQVVTYGSEGVSFELPYKGPLREVGLASRLTPAQRSQACAKGDDEGLWVDFGK